MRIRNQYAKSIRKIHTIVIGSENLLALNSPDKDMVQRFRSKGPPPTAP